jgi:biopolymer transport protein ExbD
MIDVVFLLLIFFMVTSSFQKTERELDPAVKVERKAGSQAQDLAPAIVEVVRGGGGEFVYKLGGREMTSTAELTEVLKQFENRAQAFVRPHDDAPVQMAIDAVQACKDARFVIATYEVPM